MHFTRDKLWKSIIEDFWPDFLRYFFSDIEHLIDFERDVVFLDKDLNQLFPDREEGDRRVDILMQVWFKNGTSRWFLVHTEIQGYDDKRFAQRMFTYYYRIWDKHNRAITTLVIFLNENPAFQPARFTRKFAGTELTLSYRTLVLHAIVNGKTKRTGFSKHKQPKNAPYDNVSQGAASVCGGKKNFNFFRAICLQMSKILRIFEC